MCAGRAPISLGLKLRSYAALIEDCRNHKAGNNLHAGLKNHEESGWRSDLSLRAGVQLDGVLVTRDLQLLLEYFRGHSPNGQFYKQKIDCIGLGAHFHF